MINLSLNWWDYIALFSIFFIGIPHGALDGAIAITLGYTKELTQKLNFIIVYRIAVSLSYRSQRLLNLHYSHRTTITKPCRNSARVQIKV